MPPKKVSGPSIERLNKDVENLKLALTAAQEKASTGRMRHSGKNLVDIQQRLELAEDRLRQAKKVVTCKPVTDAQVVKHMANPDVGEGLSSKRKREDSLSDVAALDMELDLLDEEPERALEEAKSIASCKQPAGPEVDHPAEVAGIGEEGPIGGIEEPNQVSPGPSFESDETIHGAKPNEVSLSGMAEDPGRPEGVVHAMHTELPAIEIAAHAGATAALDLAREDAVRMIEMAERVGMESQPVRYMQGSIEHTGSDGLSERAGVGMDVPAEQKPTGHTSFGSLAAKLMLSFIDEKVRHAGSQGPAPSGTSDGDGSQKIVQAQALDVAINEGALYRFETNEEGGQGMNPVETMKGLDDEGASMVTPLAKGSKGRAKKKKDAGTETKQAGTVKASGKGAKKENVGDNEGGSVKGDVVMMREKQKEYDEMSAFDKKTFDSAGESQIRLWLANPTLSIDNKVRQFLRLVPDYLPQSAAVSTQLTIHILTTAHKNLRCLFHGIYRHMEATDLDVAAALELTRNNKLSLTGVSGKVRKGSERIFYGAEQMENQIHDITHLDCGCSVEESVFYFWLWKTWRLHGMGGTVVEPMTSIHVTPRLRSVIYQNLMRWGGIHATLDCIFAGVLASEDENRERMLKHQLRCLTGELGGLYTARGKPLLGDEVLRILLEGTPVETVGDIMMGGSAQLDQSNGDW